jgi:hypothetical protein
MLCSMATVLARHVKAATALMHMRYIVHQHNLNSSSDCKQMALKVFTVQDPDCHLLENEVFLLRRPHWHGIIPTFRRLAQTSRTTVLSRDWLWTGFVLVIGFIEHLQNITTSNYNSLTELHTPKITVTTAHRYKVFSVITSRCLVAASTADVPFPPDSRTVPVSAHYIVACRNVLQLRLQTVYKT